MGARRAHSLLPLAQLEAATLLSGAGNGAALVVLPWLVLERTGSAGSAGLLAAATAVPLLLSSVFSGTVVDTIGRRRTALLSDVMSAVSVAAIPVLDQVLGLELGWLVALAVLGAVFDPAGVTARETMLPAAAGRAGWPLERANGVHEAVWGVAFLLGPGIGGVLIAWVGAIDALWFTAAAFSVSALAVATLRLPDSGRPPVDHAPEGIWSATAEGLAFVWRDPLLRSLTLMTALIVSVYMPIEGVLLPVEFESRGEPGRLGIIVMAMSAGGIAGALGYGLFARHLRRSLVFRGALVLTACFLLVLAALPPFPAMVVAAVGIGLAYGPVGPLVNLALQTRSDERRRGRVVGIISSAEYAAGPLGYLAVGAATQRFGVAPTLLVVGVLLLAVAIAGLFVRSLGELDNLPSELDVPGDGAEVGTAERLERALDLATSGPLAVVRPPRDPDGPGPRDMTDDH